MRRFFGRLDRAWWGLALPVHYVVLAIAWSATAVGGMLYGTIPGPNYSRTGIRKLRQERLSRGRVKR